MLSFCLSLSSVHLADFLPFSWKVVHFAWGSIRPCPWLHLFACSKWASDPCWAKSIHSALPLWRSKGTYTLDLLSLQQLSSYRYSEKQKAWIIANGEIKVDLDCPQYEVPSVNLVLSHWRQDIWPFILHDLILSTFLASLYICIFSFSHYLSLLCKCLYI